MNETTLTITGSLTADPELRFTPAGIAVANFTVASNPRRFDKATNGYVDTEPIFLRCTAWRTTAENITELLNPRRSGDRHREPEVEQLRDPRRREAHQLGADRHRGRRFAAVGHRQGHQGRTHQCPRGQAR